MIYWIRQFFTRPQSHLSAFAEVAVTSILALAPLMITALVFNYKNNGNFDLSSGIAQAIGGGQLYLYAYGLFGAIFWLAFIKWDKAVHGPRRVLGFVTILVALLIVGMLGLDPTISNAKNELILKGSYWTYLSFLFIYYLLLFYHEIDPPTAENSLKKGAQDLQQRYQNMGGTTK